MGLVEGLVSTLLDIGCTIIIIIIIIAFIISSPFRSTPDKGAQ